MDLRRGSQDAGQDEQDGRQGSPYAPRQRVSSAAGHGTNAVPRLLDRLRGAQGSVAASNRFI